MRRTAAIRRDMVMLNWNMSTATNTPTVVCTPHPTQEKTSKGKNH